MLQTRGTAAELLGEPLLILLLLLLLLGDEACWVCWELRPRGGVTLDVHGAETEAAVETWAEADAGASEDTAVEDGTGHVAGLEGDFGEGSRSPLQGEAAATFEDVSWFSAEVESAAGRRVGDGTGTGLVVGSGTRAGHVVESGVATELEGKAGGAVVMTGVAAGW